MDTSNSIILNRFFTRNTFKQLVDEGTCPTYTAVVRRYIVDSANLTNGECISRIYHYLKQEYQNEYYYKNTLLNKLLLGVHNLHTTTALTEVPVEKSKADFILINGKAVVYEIKTALDNFERLDGQLNDYYKAFSRVVLVTSERNCEEAQKRLRDSPTGIFVLTKRGTISTIKQPVEYTDNLSRAVMFKILRKIEYERILYQQLGYLPQVSQFEYYRECQSLFESLPIDIAYGSFIQMLKLRTKIEVEQYDRIPYELKFLIYFSDYRGADYSKLINFLNA